MAPTVVKGQLWGTLATAFAAKPVPGDAKHRLARFTELVAIAIANAEAW